MPGQDWHPADAIDPTSRRADFLNREAAEVYLLLDHLSGRSDRTILGSDVDQLRQAAASATAAARTVTTRLAETDAGQAAHAAAPPAVSAREAEAARIEADLADPSRLIHRAMGIQYPLREESAAFESDAAFLVRARDQLNQRAFPASGASISFTWLVLQRPAGERSWWRDKFPNGGGGPDPARHSAGFAFAQQAFPHFVAPARQLRKFVGRIIAALVVLLVVALAVSAYSALGKLVLDEINAVRREFADVRLAIERLESVPTPIPAMKPADGSAAPSPAQAASVAPIVHFCAQPLLLPEAPIPPANRGAAGRETGLRTYASHAQYHVCDRLEDVNRRFDAAYRNLETWTRYRRLVTWVRVLAAQVGWGHPADPVRSASPSADQPVGAGEQWAASLVSVLGNFVLPVLYGLLGSLAFVLRRIYDRMADSLLTVRDRRASTIRLALGGLTGACIGLFFNSDTTVPGAVTFSAPALAFLAGYAVEGVFKALDGVITQVFRFNDSGASTQPPRSSS